MLEISEKLDFLFDPTLDALMKTMQKNVVASLPNEDSDEESEGVDVMR